MARIAFQLKIRPGCIEAYDEAPEGLGPGERFATMREVFRLE